jgi:hypothetical protein
MPETAREHMLNVVDFVTDGGLRRYTIAGAIAEFRIRGTRFADSTIWTCASSPDNHGAAYADFDRSGRAEYRWRR